MKEVKPAQPTSSREKSVTPPTETTSVIVQTKTNKTIWILGALVILLAALGIWKFIYKPAVPVSTILPQAQALILAVNSPADGTLAVNNEILVTGITSPNTTVVIYTESDEVIVTSDANGKFESTVKLTSGINSLNIYAFGDDGSEKTVSLDIVYDQES